MNIYEVLLEAEDETISVEPDETNSSYSDEAENEVSEAEDEEIETTDEDQSESDVESEEEPTDDDDSDEDTNFTDEAEDSVTDDETEPTDDTESGESSDSDGENSEETATTDPSELIKKHNLLKDFINLYENINLVMDKLDKIPVSDMIVNRVIIQVRKNFSKMAEYIYDIITRLYNAYSYMKNLYVYNYFIESYRINVEMLKKINVFTLNA